MAIEGIFFDNEGLGDNQIIKIVEAFEKISEIGVKIGWTKNSKAAANNGPSNSKGVVANKPWDYCLAQFYSIGEDLDKFYSSSK